MERPAEIHVVAGAIADADGRVLIAQRPRGRHMAGRWEFPGGKLAAGEEPLAGLKRELSEELGISVRAARPLIRLRHEYPDRRVLLDVWQVTDYEGLPQALDAQALAWAKPDDLPKHDLLEADRAIVTALRLPRLARLLAPGETLQSIRGRAAQTILVPMPEEGGAELDAEAVARARAAGHRVFVMGADIDAVRVAALARCDGVLMHWQGQSLHIDHGGAFLVGVHCDDAESATRAVAEGAHFIVFAPEDGSPSDRMLERLCGLLGRPVFAGWHPDARQLERLQQLGAHGCAVRR
ncbi:MAG TPA: NUDIX domain-containing protein [Steroidobacteraceae bacterium]|nr:NUDIX domain-containing protein [Steroidobacteraceae bacterium]